MSEVNQKLGNNNLVLPLKAAAEIKLGTMVALGADGYAVKASKVVGLTMAGVSQEDAINSAADGAESIKVKRGAFVFQNAGDIEVTDLLQDCYVEDEVTVTLVADLSSKVGKILAVDEEGVTVEIQ